MKLISTEVLEPAVSLEEAKAFLRQDQAIDDALIRTLIDAASDYIMRWTGRAIGLVEITEAFDDWDSAANPNRFPLVEDSASPIVRYLDSSNDLQTLDSDSFEIVEGAAPASIKFDSTPSIGDGANPIRITYQAGEAPTPAMLRVAVLTLVSHWYQNREAVIVGTIQGPTLIQLESILHLAGIPYLGVSE